MIKPALFLTAALALAAALCPAQAAAQMDSRTEEQSFDYDPGAQEAAKIVKSMAQTTYEDADIVEHPIYGTIVISKHRWKNWVVRALYLTMINIALLAIIMSLSKTEEYNIIVGYILSGISATLSFWVFLCAILLVMLESNAWMYVLPPAMVTGGAGYLVLMKIKKYDVSLSELKESFQRMRAASREDSRLSSVQGTPGDWPAEDFIL